MAYDLTTLTITTIRLLNIIGWATFLFISSLILYLIQNEVVRYFDRVKKLPGPLGWPVVGNLFQNSTEFPAETYRKWSQIYGDVFQIQLGNTTAVIVNSVESAKQLFLGQRHAMNSRPVFYVFHKQVSKAVTSIGTSPWDDSCKRRRKLAAGALNRVRVNGYAPILNLEAREFIRDLHGECLDGSVEIDFRPAVKRFALNLSLTLNYGTRVSSVKTLTDDPLLAEIIYVESEISKLRDTTKNYANYIPLLRYWQPIAKFLSFNKSPGNHGGDIGRRRQEYNNVLLDRLKDEVSRGEDKHCIQGAVLRDPDSATLTREELLSVSLSMMAGADSNQPTLAWAILLLAHRPDVQSKAYMAIKEAGALDKPSNSYASTKIEYIDALTKEINRYFTVLRLALPKATYSDVTWEAATIPANTTVFLNAWACNRDPKQFSQPDMFIPERWLQGSTDQHIHQFAFGIGGRMCVASHLAQGALYTAYVHLISRFQILPAKGSTDMEIDPVAGLSNNSFVSTPKGYRARFIPRDGGGSLESWLDNPGDN